MDKKQKGIFIACSIVIIVLLIIGFVVSMNMNEGTSDKELADGTTSEDATQSNNGGNSDGNTENSGSVDPLSTPIEGGDVNSIDTYLPHEGSVEIDESLSEEGIYDIDYTIEVDKDNKVITVNIPTLDDKGAEERARAYLATIPSEVLSGYRVETAAIFDDDFLDN